MMMAMLTGAAVAATAPLPVKRMGVYVVADDLARSRAFYEKLFGAPQVALPALIGFDVAGAFYAVVARATYAPDARRGDTMRGYLKVADIAAAFAQAKQAVPDALERTTVTVEGRFRFFRLRDPDGNVIEFFAVG